MVTFFTGSYCCIYKGNKGKFTFGSVFYYFLLVSYEQNHHFVAIIKNCIK